MWNMWKSIRTSPGTDDNSSQGSDDGTNTIIVYFHNLVCHFGRKTPSSWVTFFQGSRCVCRNCEIRLDRFVGMYLITWVYTFHCLTILGIRLDLSYQTSSYVGLVSYPRMKDAISYRSCLVQLAGFLCPYPYSVWFWYSVASSQKYSVGQLVYVQS